MDIERLKQLVDSKIIQTNEDTNGMHDIVKQKILPAIQNITDPILKQQIIEKLNQYSAEKYSSLTNINSNNTDEHYSSKLYHKKETKNYNKEFINDEYVYVWDGKYYYNRALDGQKIDAFYDENTEIGEIMNYYFSDGLYIEDADSGSNGSDILIGTNIIGQTADYGEYGTEIKASADSIQNGDDVIIAQNAIIYSGNNLVFANKSIKGGNGNDLLICNGLYLYDNIKINHQNKENSSRTIAIGLGNFKIYSSSNKNTIIASSNEGYGGTVYGTGGDKIIFDGLGSHSLISGLDGHYNSLNVNVLSNTFFYEKEATFNPEQNKIYSGDGKLLAFLSKNDYLDASKGRNTIYGHLNNVIILGDFSILRSKGSSEITIRGKENTLYLGFNDLYQMNESSNNYLYTAGYEKNEEHSSFETYTINGFNNRLYLGLGNYNVIANGYSSQISIEKHNSNEVNINTDEQGETRISHHSINKLTINNNNPITLMTYSPQAFEQDAAINDLEINSNSNLSLYQNNIETASLTSKGNLDIASANIKKLTINAEQNLNIGVFSEVVEINSDVLDTEHNFQIAGEIDSLYINTKSKAGIHLSVKSNKVDIKNANIDFSSSKIKELTLDGILNGTNETIDDETLITVNGQINATLQQIDYLEINQPDSEEKSSIIIKDSTLNDHKLDNLLNADIQLINSQVNDIVLNGEQYSINIDTNSLISDLKVKANKDITIKSESVYNNVIEINAETPTSKILISNPKLYNLSLSDSNTVIADTADLLEINADINTSTFINTQNVSTLNLNSGSFTFDDQLKYNSVLAFQELNINLDGVIIEDDSISYINRYTNKNLFCNSQVRLSYKDGFYYLNNFKTDDLNQQILVSSKLYSVNEVFALLYRLKYDSADSYAILDSKKSSYYLNGKLEELPEENNPEIIIGTGQDDYIQLSENKTYLITSSQGNDTFEFLVTNHNQNILNYSAGSGLTTIKAVNNPIYIQIKLGYIDENLISYEIEEHDFANEKILTIKYKDLNIIKVYNYMNVSLQLFFNDKYINNSDIESSIFSIYGTDSDDVLNGNHTTSIFNPGKGNDLINILGRNNTINYSSGDGLKTIDNPNYYSVLISLTNVKKTDLSYELLDDSSLNIKENKDIIFKLNQPSAALLQFAEDYEIVYIYSIVQELSSVNGTDGDDILNGNPVTSVFNAGKGNDLINILGGSNTINYLSGDGFKVINNPNYGSVMINLTNVEKNSLCYELLEDSSLNIKEKNSVIFNLKQPNLALLQFTENNEMVNLYLIVQDLLTINGTNDDDILTGNSFNTNIFNPKKGNDIIHIVSNFNQVNYTIGDGYKVISNPNFKTVILVLDGVLDRALLNYKMIDKKLNIYYDSNLIFNIENPISYSIQFKDTYDYIYMYQVI